MNLFKNISKKIFVISLLLAVLFSFIPLSNASSVDVIDASVKQAKTANDSTVYYLDHARGMKKAYVSETAFLSYGNQWSDIRVVSESELERWPDVRLVKASGESAIYFIKDGEKYLIKNEEEFTGYEFKWDEVVAINKIDLDSYKTTDSNKIISSGNSGLFGGGNDASLNVQISETSPATKYIPTGSVNNLTSVLRFANTAGEVEINSLTLSLDGVVDSSIINKVYVEDANGSIYGYQATFSNRKAYINFGNEPIVVYANEVRDMFVKVDLNNATGVEGQSFSIGIKDYTDINANASVYGVFPVMGNSHKLVEGQRYLGRVEVSHVILSTIAKDINIGAQREAITSFSIAETSGIEDVTIQSITMSNSGDSYPEDIKNIRLYTSKGKLVAESQMYDNEVVFDLNNYSLLKNHSETFVVKVDIMSGDGRSVKLIIKEVGDIKVKSSLGEYGINVQGSFPIGSLCGNTCDSINIKHQPVFATTKNLSKDKLNIYADQSDAVIGLFEIRNDSSDITVKSITASVVTSSGAPALDKEIKIINNDTGHEIATVDGGKITNNHQEVSFFNYQIAPNDTIEVAFITHIPDTAVSGNAYRVYIESINYEASGGGNQLLSDAVKIDGQNRQVVTPGIYIFAGSFKEKDVAVAGDEKVKLASFKLEATSDETVKINSITITNVYGYTNVDYLNGFTNLALYKGSSKISEVIANPNSNFYTFGDVNLKISAGKSVEFSVKADASVNVAGEIKIAIDNIMAKGYKSKAPVVVSNQSVSSQSVVFGKTTLNVEAIAGGIVNKEKYNLIASFNFTNNSPEAIKLKYATVVTNGCYGGFTATNGFSSLRFGYEDNGKVKYIGSNISKPVAESNRLSFSSYKLNAGEIKTINLYVNSKDSLSDCELSLHLKDIEAYGYYSKVKAVMSANETANVNVVLSTPVDAEGALAWPVIGSVNYDFHDSSYPFKDVSEHEGIDIEADQGTPVRAAGSGTVATVYDGGADGYSYIIINHGNSLSTVYGHLSRIDVTQGDMVARGQEVGLSGGTPGTPGAGEYSTGSHLHFEVRVNGTSVDPEDYLD